MINVSFDNVHWVSTMVLISWQESKSREEAQTPLTVEFTQWRSTQHSRGAIADVCGNKRLILGSDYGSVARVEHGLELWHLDPRMSCCWWEPRNRPTGIKPWVATKYENVYLFTSQGPTSAAAAELQHEGISAHLCFPWQLLHSVLCSWVSELQMEYWQKISHVCFKTTNEAQTFQENK